MKSILSFTFFIFFIGNGLFAQDMLIEKISPALWEKMVDAEEEHFSVYILLEDQVDILGMRARFNQEKTSIAERTYAVITSLETKAAETQEPLLAYLRSNAAIDQESIRPYWITNLVQVELTAEQIKDISLRRDVGKLELITPSFLFEGEKAEAAPPVPNGSEPGLRAINADKLWQMGYTGYSRRIMIHDSGVAGKNPALRLNYQGFYAEEDNDAYTGSAQDGSTDCQIFGIFHGTHVAGTTCGLNRLTNDTIGVAFNAKWLSAPNSFLVGACEDAAFTDMQNFQWALNPDGDANTTDDMPDVINNSFGGLGDCQNSSALSNVQDALETAGVAVVWAAGNDGPGTSTTSTASDINHDLVISFSVGALNSSNVIAGFSSRGPSDCSAATSSLEIKPEVSAPGVNIRSSNGNFGYANSQGTSMAAPHVAGAVALLKEAYPEVTGEAIKLALYNTCTDLGAPGEDNNYGMGIINVLEAFNYLQAQGNTPTTPERANDVMIVNIEEQDPECGTGIFNSQVLIENAGTSPLTSATIAYEFLQGNTVAASGSFDWTGNLNTTEREMITLPEVSGLNGQFDYRVSVGNPNGTADERPLNNIYGFRVEVVQVEPLEGTYVGATVGNPCAQTTATIFVDNPDVISADWYALQSSGPLLGSGLYFETISLPNPFTYYVVPRLSGSGGIVDPNTTTTATASEDGEGLVFDVLAETRLVSTKIYSEGGGLCLFRLVSPQGSNIASRTMNISEPGEYQVDWGIDLEPGSGYRMELGTGTAPLKYTTNPGFPYSVGGAITINESTDFDDPSSKYYYFYDWTAEYTYACGRVPVLVDFGGSDGPEVNFTIDNSAPLTNQNISFTNSTVNATDYVWDFGDGNTSTDENPTHVYTEVGTYTVYLSAVNGDGCMNTVSQEITVDLNTSTELNWLDESVSIFPNPTSSQLNILMNLEENHDVQIELVDVLGRQIKSIPSDNIRQANYQLDMSGLTNGVYYVVIMANDTRIVRKVAKMN